LTGAAIALALAGALLPATAAEVKYEPNWASLDTRPIPQWFLNAKFGIFIHWGVYSVPCWGAPHTYAEWYWHNMADHKPGNVWWQFHKENYGADFKYQDFAPMFRAELFDPAQWAELFHRAGARYVVLTSKHHEGFCLWQSAEANRDWGRPWNAVDIGPHRDLLGDLAKAVRRRGLKFGIYYSLYEWFNPLWLTNRPLYVEKHMIPQFKDVVTRYAPSLIFADGEWDLTSKQWQSERLLAWLYNDSPCKEDVVVDDRWGKDTRHKHGDYFTTEYGAGMANAAHPWEEDRGMGYSYGYNRAETLSDYRTGRELVLMLVDLVSRGGNLLLDIGPTADGRVPVIMQERLTEIGDWLRVNGEAIYGTRHAGRDCQWSAGKRPGQKHGEFMIQYNLMQQIGQKPRNGVAVKQAFFTQKPDTLYAITPGWPGRTLVLRGVRVPPGSEITLLGVNGKLNYRLRHHTLTLRLPDLNPDQLPCHYAYTFKIPGGELLPHE
jgi:alpha-L-fucosidase